MRADLIQRRVWMGRRQVWVVKDPLTRSFFYFSDQEHEILGLADGTRSLSEITAECSRRMAPEHFSAESLLRFFADAQSKGLLLGGQAETDTDAGTQRRWWHNPLAIRLPGFNPDRLLEWMLPVVKPVFSPLAATLAVILILLAIAVAAKDFDLLAQHVSAATSRLRSGRSLVILVVVISMTKIVHELAHALACKGFGGQCREMGVMLLLGVPCLYCDVSDAWMLELRWKRILVSAAGMLAELTLAAIATLFWVFTLDGPVRDLCVAVMVVCSVTTVLFNGNPLLRYDGYYILSDLVAIPNLAGQSAAVIRGWFRRLLWAMPVLGPSAPAGGKEAFIAVYGVASGLYRTMVYLLIGWMFYRVANAYDLGPGVAVVLLSALGYLVFRWGRLILTPPERSVRRSSLSSRRPMLVFSGLVTAGLILCLVPIPRSIVAPMSIQPAGLQTVFVAGEGAIVQSLSADTHVHRGQVIARLSNPDVERERLAIELRCDTLAARLDGLRRSRGASREHASRIPAVEKALEEATKQKRLRESVAQRLIIRSPRDGRLYAAGNHMESTPSDTRQPRFWNGTPLEPVNRGAWLPQGTPLCVVGDPSAREATVILRQQDIELIAPDQPVTLLLADHRRGAVTGRVLQVAASPSHEIPKELRRAGLIDRSATDPSRSNPYYQVRVILDPTSAALPVRLTGHAQITVRPASILARIGRFLGDAFG